VCALCHARKRGLLTELSRAKKVTIAVWPGLMPITVLSHFCSSTWRWRVSVLSALAFPSSASTLSGNGTLIMAASGVLPLPLPTSSSRSALNCLKRLATAHTSLLGVEHFIM
jgi:hypothetical protein